jgi:hypothetical protein
MQTTWPTIGNPSFAWLARHDLDELSDDFAEDCVRAGLSDAAFRTDVEALTWTMRRETDGYLDKIDIRKAIETVNVAAAIAERLAVGFWQQTEHGYIVKHHMEDQPEPEIIAKRRDLAAERARKSRRKKAGLVDD